LVRQIAALGPAHLVLADHSEFNLYATSEFDPLDFLEVSELEEMDKAYETPGAAEALWPCLYRRAVGRALIEASKTEEPRGVQGALEQLAAHLTDHEVDVLEGVYRTPSSVKRSSRDHPRYVVDLINGRAGVSPAMAIRLAKAFGGSPETWLKLQMQYDLAKALQNEAALEVQRVTRPAA
jgi:hypothetical protein